MLASMLDSFARTVSLTAFLFVACVSPDERQIDDTHHAANYERVFGSPAPANVEVVRSRLVKYRSSASVAQALGPTDDWKFELLAPRAWIDDFADDLGMRRADKDDGIHRSLAEARQRSATQEWYAPRPIECYEVYYLYMTSIPYVFFYVEREPQADGRFRFFASKL